MKKLKFFLINIGSRIANQVLPDKRNRRMAVVFFIFDFVWLVQKSFCAMPIDVQNHDGWRDLSEI